MDKKRKSTEYSNNNNISNKRSKIIDWNTMISASSVKNYMLDDPLLDWLKYYSIDTMNSIPRAKNHNDVINNDVINNNDIVNTHTDFIMAQGIEFEKQVFEYLKNNFNTITITTSNMSHSYEKYQETIQAMKDGNDIIYQGVLHDYKNHIFGSPDLLVRSDKFNDIFNYIVPNVKSKKLGIKFHYVVVDIKHSTLNFNTNQEYLLNNNSIPAYKGQILIYNRILGLIQGYTPECGYILGKKMVYTKKNTTHTIDNYMQNIAPICYTTYDKIYNEKVDKALEWHTRMRTEGHNWKLLPNPSVAELYPNMKNDKDSHYRKIKIDIADRISEITNVWWCGYNKRVLAHSLNIFSWKDKRLTSKILQFNNTNTAKMLDNILDINRSNKKISMNRTIDLKSTINTLEFYIDFETMNSNIGQVTDEINTDIIFMVGLGWVEKDPNNPLDQYMYKTFILETNNNSSEHIMMNNMLEFVKNKMIELNKTNTIYIHWTNAEVSFYKKFTNKHPTITFPELNFYDLYKVFIDNNIVVKGALNFSLKSIANAMYKHKMIKSTWDNSTCMSGLQAIYLAYKYYNNNPDINIMNDITKYNMIDCKVMYEILLYLRNN